MFKEPPLQAEAGRELLAEDLVVLDTTNLGKTAPPLARIREVHHQIARLLASGIKHCDVSAIVGISQSRISILLADPTFRELVDHYASAETAAFASVRDRMVTLGLDAAAELHERILERPEEISNKTLVNVLESALDRGGHAPVKRSENVNATLTTEEIATLRAAGNSAVRTKEEVLQSSPGAVLGNPVGVSLDSAPATAGGEGEGPSI